MLQQVSARDLHPGKVLGDLTLIGRVRTGTKGCYNSRRRWRVRCSCGNVLTIPQHYLLREPHPKRNCGECKKSLKTRYNREYRILLMIIRRCTNPTHVAYQYYGGRGIRVHEEWLDCTGPESKGFDKFLECLGPAPTPSHSVDRINVDGNYEPGNVRWATAKEQAQNTRAYLKKRGLLPGTTRKKKVRFKHPIGEQP